MDARHLLGAPHALAARQIDDEAAEPGEARYLATQRRLLGGWLKLQQDRPPAASIRGRRAPPT
jgi:hypothetical protein